MLDFFLVVLFGLLTFAALHTGWPASAVRCAARYHAPLAVAMGALLGVSLCWPWMLMQQRAGVRFG